MAMYKMSKRLFDNEIDTLATKYSLRRIKDESIDTYTDRIYYQTKNPISQHISDIGFYLNNTLGLTETAIFKIDLRVDQTGEPLYPFAYFEVDSYYFHIIKDNFEPEDKISIAYREFDTFNDLFTEINSYKILDCSTLHNIDMDIYKDTYSLKVQTNKNFADVHFHDAIVNLPHKNILEVLNYSTLLTNEVEDFKDIKGPNDYFFDRRNGKIFMFPKDKVLNTGEMHYSFVKYPFYLKKQPIKISLGKDPSFLNLVKEDIEERRGEVVKKHITSKGWSFYNPLLNSSPIYWGH